MTHSLTSTLRRPDSMAIALRKTFLPVIEMTEALEGALERLIVLDLDDRPRDDDERIRHGAVDVATALVWRPRSLQRQIELTR